MEIKDIYQIFSHKAIAQYWENVNIHIPDPYIGPTLFPNNKKLGLELSWIRGKNGLPVVLQPSAFDAKASLRDRIGVTEISTEMPFFREAMRLGEKDRQDIMNLLSKGTQYVEPIISRLFDDASGLIDGAEAQAERMRMQLITNGQINVVASKGTGRTAAYSYNYDPDSSWTDDHTITLTGTGTWTEENAATFNPIKDLMDAKKVMLQQFGKRMTRVIMNSTTLNNMLRSEIVLKAMNPVGYQNILVTDEDITKFIQAKTGLSFIIYDKMYQDEEGNQVSFYPDNYVTLLPAYTLGNTWFGTTPEGYDLLSDSQAPTSVIGSGITVTTLKEKHPVNISTIVSAIMLPSFERMDDIYVIKTK